MSKWIPGHIHSIFSIMDGLCKLDKLASRVKELGYTSCMITDHGNVSGCVKFHGEMKKKGIKPILGSELYISREDSNIKNDENRKLDHMVIIAKNKDGWQRLMNIVSASNHPTNKYYKPRLDVHKLAKLAEKNFIVFTGHHGSILHRYAMNMEASKKCIAELKELFGEENVIIELQLFRLTNLEEQKLNLEYVNFLRQLAKETNTKAFACQDVHYINQQDANLQRIMLCSNLGKTLNQIEKMPEKPMSGFFDNDCFYLPSPQQMTELGYTEEELDMSFISDQCEMYDIQNQPLLPKFCDNEPEYIKQLCRDGWKKKRRAFWDEKTYVNRLKKEFEVLDKWNLNGYFLIVQDFINWAKKEGMFVGPGRGSSGGSLVAYLTNITEVDPIEFDLSFERFFNESRCSPGNISLPDIDTDFPSTGREAVIEYIKFRYGKENVAKIATFGALKGKAALKEVFRIYEVCDFNTMNEITSGMPNEAEIADELEEQDEDSIISWCLNNNPKIFKDYCKIENGVLTGEYAKYFKIAIDLEGVYKSHGIHAAGLIITDRPITELSPVFYDDKTGEAIVALDKKDAEKIGLTKMDILGLSILSKLQMVKHMLKYGK